MKLILLQTPESRLEIADFPSALLTSRKGLENFLKLYAGRVFGGREGRDWKICAREVNANCLVPLTVNQLVPSGPNGQIDYGQQLVIE